MNNHDLFRAAQNEVQGFFNDNGGDPYNSFYNAAGQPVAQPQARMSLSRPYNFNVDNTTGADDTLNLFNSNANYNAANYGNTAGINITGATTFSYEELLGTFIGNGGGSFNLGLIRFTTTATAQLSQPVTVQTKYPQGDFGGKVLDVVPQLNQFLTNTVAVYCGMTIYGNTLIYLPLLSSVTGAAAMNIRMYPSDVLAPYRTFDGQDQVKQLGSPNNLTLPVSTVIRDANAAARPAFPIR